MKKINIKSKKFLILVAVVLTAIITAIASMQVFNSISSVSEAERVAMTYEELEETDIKTQSDNVEFSAFFPKDLNGDGVAERVNGATIRLGSSDTLYAELKVSTEGSLRNGTITLNGENVSWTTAIVADSIVAKDYIGETSSIQLADEIQAGSQRLFSGKLSSKLGNNINDYSKVNSMTLTGLYVDDQGNETPIDVTREFTVDWYGSINTDIVSTTQNINVTKYDTTMQLRFNVSVKETIGQLLLKDLDVEITAPELNGYKAIEGSITSNVSEFDSETGVLRISKESTIDSNGNIMQKVPSLNTYTVIFTYPIEAHGDETADGKLYTNIDVPVKAKYTAYNNQKEGFTNIVSSTDTDTIRLVEEKGVIVPPSDAANVYIGKKAGDKYVISKESAIQAYNGNESEDEKYQVIWRFEHNDTATNGNVTLKETRTDEGKTKTNSSFNMMNYVTIDSVQFYLNGSTGGISLYNDETGELIRTFTNSEIHQASEYELEGNVKQIRVEVSSLSQGATLQVYQTKRISNEALVANVSRSDFDYYNGVYTYLTTSGANYASPSYYSAYANYSELESDIAINLSKKTVKTNELSFDETIKISTKGGLYNQIYWQDGAFLVELPEEIINIENVGVSINNSNVQIIGYDFYEQKIAYNNEKHHFIKVLTKNDERTSYNISISFKAYIDPLATSGNATVSLYSYNKDCNNYVNSTTDTFDVNNNNNKGEEVALSTQDLNVVAPETVLIGQSASNYDEESNIVIAPNSADVRKEKRTVNINLNVLNNDSKQVVETKILGVLPYVGNKYISSGNNLNSEFTATMSNNGIQVPNELYGKVTIYYTENGEADKDLENQENLWTKTPTDWTKVKKYLIDFGNNTLPSGEKYTFTYTAQIPEGIDYNQISYSEYMMYYAINTSGGKLYTELEPSKLGIRVARKYGIEITKLNKENGKPVQGAVYRLTGYDRLGEVFSIKLITTNTEGKLITNDLYVDNTYVLEEISNPENYELNTDVIRFKVTENSDKNLEVTVLSEDTFKTTPVIEDDVLKASVEDEPRYKITVTKIDNNTQEPIKGVQFYVNKVDKTYTTNAEGQTELKPLSQNEEYTLKELNAFGYYLIDDITFKLVKENNSFRIISENEEFANAEVVVKEDEDLLSAEVTIENEKQPSISIKKTNKTTGNPIADVRFSVDGRIGKIYETNEQGEVLIEGFAENQDYTLIETRATGYYPVTVNFKIVRDANNKLKIESDNEEFSNARVIDEGNKILQVEMTNEEIETYNLEIVKISEGTEDVTLEGAKFNLLSDDENTVKAYETDENGKIQVSGLYTYKEGKNIEGTYTLQETEAPEGYSNNAEQIKFRLKKTNDEYEVEILNENNVKTLKSATYEEGTVKLVIEDKPMFTLTKVDQETGEPLANVGFIIMELTVPPTYAKDVNGNYVGVQNEDEQYIVTTDENGQIRLPLKNGKYALIEAIYPEGYVDEEYIAYFKVSKGETGEDDTLIKEIEKIEDLVEFSKKVNNFNNYEGIEVNLNNTIDFNEDSSYRNPEDISYGDLNGDGIVEGIKTELTKESGKGFTPIGSFTGTYFKGTFNGNNNEIRNLYINGSYTNCGLFGNASSGVIKDLGITGNIKAGTATNVGGIAGTVNIITNCYNKATITAGGANNGLVGGIVGSASGTISYCHNEGNVNYERSETSSSGRVAGIAGYAGAGDSIIYCYNTGNIYGKYLYSAAGIIGDGDYNLKVSYCYNSGNIELEARSQDCSGIGYCNAKYCYNTGTIIGRKYGTSTSYRLYTTGISRKSAYNSYDVGKLIVYDGAEVYNSGYSTANTTLEYMKTEDFLNDLNDTKNVFRMDTENVNNGYPVFVWLDGVEEEEEQEEIEYIEKIETVEDLKKLSQQVTSGISYEGRTVTLENTLDMTDVEYTSIGAYGKYFKGTFDGKGNKIENLSKPVFEYTQSATIKNLEISGNINGRAGIIVSDQGGTTVENCINNATVTGPTDGTYGAQVGGIIGYASGNYQTTIRNCINNGKISADYHVGGIVGNSSNSHFDIINCINNGEIILEGSRNEYIRAGGIVGNSYYCRMYNCYNTGNITATVSGAKNVYVGGIAGSSTNINKCYNKGNITVNASDIQSWTYASGISASGSIVCSYNVGNIEVNANNTIEATGVGGSSLMYCYNTGNINANSSINDARVGGVIAEDKTQEKGYYLETIQLVGNTTYNNGTAKSSEYMKSDEFIDELNSYLYQKDTENVNDGYPTFKEDTDTQVWNEDIEYIEDLVDLSKLSSLTGAFEYDVKLTRTLDFNEDSSYRDPEDTSYGDLNGDETIEGIKAELTNTNGSGFKPIGPSENFAFTGTFDGQGNKIENIYIKNSNTNYTGLFGYVKNATIKNIEISGKIQGTNYVGSLIGMAQRQSIVLENCINNATVEGQSQVGGLVGSARQCENVKINNCINNGSVNDSGYYAGGIIGEGTDANLIEITNCTNNGVITGYSEIGGIIGYTYNTKLYMDNCHNTAHINANSDFVGGIVGLPSNGIITIKNCSNTGTVDSQGYSGGIIGYSGSASLVEISNCFNTGDINHNSTYGSHASGGIVGQGTATKITDCYNTGKIKAPDRVGGILGQGGWDGNDIEIVRCYNKGELIMTDCTSGYLIAGIAGSYGGKIEECYNEGKITYDANNSSSYVGGIVGNTYNNTNIIKCYNIVDIDVKTNYSADIGGIAGGYGEATIKDSYNLGNITYESESQYCDLGGIVARGGKVENSYNKGNIIVKSSGSSYSYVGGIVGNQGTVYNSYNTGNIDANIIEGYICGIGHTKYNSSNPGGAYNSYNTGNITAIADDNYTGYYGLQIEAYGVTFGTATNCYNTGDINVSVPKNTSSSAYAYAGGVSEIDATNCYNTGNITARGRYVYVGGITTRGAKIENCYNTGNMAVDSLENTYIGGISGASSYDSSYIKNCYNTGNIENTINFASTSNSCYCYIGGINAGYYAKIENTYNKGNIKQTVINEAENNSSAFTNVGGISGKGNIVTNSYSLGDIDVKTQNIGTTKIGRIVGYHDDGVPETQNYYLSTQNLNMESNSDTQDTVVLTEEIPLDSIEMADIKSEEFYNIINGSEVWAHFEGYEPKLYLNTTNQTDATHVKVTNKIQKFDITTDVDETSGTKGGSITGEDEKPYETVNYGKTNTKEIVMTPDDGYKITKITINDEQIVFEPAEDGTFTMNENYFENVQEDKHIVVTYALKEQELLINKVDKDTGRGIEGAVFDIESLTGTNEIFGLMTANGTSYFEEYNGTYIPNNVNNGEIANSYVPINLTNEEGEYYVVVNADTYSGDLVATVSEDTTPITSISQYSTEVFLYVNGGATQSQNYTSHLLQAGKQYYLKFASTSWSPGAPYANRINSIKLYKKSADNSNNLGELTSNNTTRTFVKNESGTITLGSSTQGTEGANAYMEIDLTNKAGTYNVLLNANTQIQQGAIFIATIQDNANAYTNYNPFDKFVYVNKDSNNDTYVSKPLEGGKKYYLQLAYTGGNIANEININSIILAKSSLSEVFVNNIDSSSEITDENQVFGKLTKNTTNTSYYAFEQKEGKYVTIANNQATGCIEVDLTNKTGKYNVLVDVNIQNNGPLIAKITTNDNLVTDGSPYCKFVYISGTVENSTYSSPVLEGGNKYYLHLVSTMGGSIGGVSINKIQLVENNVVESFNNTSNNIFGNVTNNGEYYFEYTDGKLVPNNNNEETELANSYIPINLEGKTGKYAIVLKAESQSPTIVATVSENTEAITGALGGNYWSNNVFMWVNGGSVGNGADKDYTYVSKPLESGKTYYLKIASDSRKAEYNASINSVELVQLTDEETFKNNKGNKFEAVGLRTDKNGQIRVVVPHIGKYLIKEVGVPEGYTDTKTSVIYKVRDVANNEVTIENKAKQKVTVHHYFKNSDGEYTTIKVAEDEVVTCDVGAYYTTAPKIDLENLELEKNADGTYKVPSNASGQVEEFGNEVTYYYEEKSIELTIHHYLEGTEEKLAQDEAIEYSPTVTVKDNTVVDVSTDQTYGVKANTNYKSLLLRNYASTAITQDEDVVEDEEITFNNNSELTYYYDMLEGTVTAKYVDKNTNEEIAEAVTTKDLVGKLYTVTQKVIDGYTFVERDGDLTGTYENEDKVVTFYYKQNAKVTVNYIDKDTDAILGTQVGTGVVGDEFTATAKDFKYYVLVERPTNETVTMTAEEIVLNYYYEKVTVGLLEKHIDLANDAILYNETHTLRAGDSYKIDAKEFEGYDLVETRLPVNAEGIMTDQAVEVVYYYVRQITVVAKYIDTETKESISEDVVQEGHEGDRYTTENKTLEGYVLKEIPTNASGTMAPVVTEDGMSTTIIVNYEYEKEAKQSPGVIEKHIDVTTNKLLEPATTHTGNVGDEYKITAKEFEGYDLVETQLPTNAEGTMTNELIEVNYYYARKIKVVAVYEDSESKVKLSEDVVKDGHVGDEYKTDAKEIDGYELKEIPTNAEGIMEVITTEDGETTTITVTYEYKKVSTTVTERHYDIKSNKVLDEKTYTGNVGDTYETRVKTFTGYDIVKDKLPTNAKGTMTKEPIEVKYYYIKKVTLTVEYKDKNTDEDIKDPVEIPLHQDDKYKPTPKAVEGYDVVEKPENGEEIEVTQDKTVVFYYKRKAVVEVKYLDKETGKELFETVVINGHEGDKYTTEEKEIEYYKLVEKPKNAEGTMTVNKITEDGKEKVNNTTEVTYYYKALDFNIKVDKEITKLTIDGKKQKISNGKLAKLEIHRKKLNTSEVTVEYTIKVSNIGELAGGTTVEETIPEGFTIDKTASDKWSEKDGKATMAVKEIKPGEEKEYKIVLNWKKGEKNIGTKVNTVQIIGETNTPGFKDSNEEDNISSAILLLTISTGSEAITQYIIAVLVLSSAIVVVILLKRKK